MSTEEVKAFNKANVYGDLKEAIKKVQEASDNNGDAKGAFTELVTLVESYKPQKGGGATKNPMKTIDGVNYHWCRFKEEYVVESEMSMSGGKSKGASIYASKHNYELGKKVQEAKDAALECFQANDYEGATKYSNDAKEIEATMELPSTYAEENLQYLRDRDAEREARKKGAELLKPTETKSEDDLI